MGSIMQKLYKYYVILESILYKRVIPREIENYVIEFYSESSSDSESEEYIYSDEYMTSDDDISSDDDTYYTKDEEECECWFCEYGYKYYQYTDHKKN